VTDQGSYEASRPFAAPLPRVTDRSKISARVAPTQLRATVSPGSSNTAGSYLGAAIPPPVSIQLRVDEHFLKGLPWNARASKDIPARFTRPAKLIDHGLPDRQALPP
jgi:hypothetical protein